MKIEIEGNEIELKGLKGRHINKLLDMQLAIESSETPGIEAKKYVNELDSIAASISNMSVEELNELLIDDKSKITGYIQNKTKDSVGF